MTTQNSGLACVTIQKTPYGGWPNCYRITNGEVELIVTSDVGPRIIRYGFAGGQNLFKEYEETMGQSGEPGWQLRGGHRLWVAPEHEVRTYAPDNSPVEIEIREGILEAIQPVEPLSGIQKRIIVSLEPRGSCVEVLHKLTNTTSRPVEVAVWSISMMAQGGIGITGFPPRGSHPEVLTPTNPLVMWAFTDLSDPRWQFTGKYLMLRQDPQNKSAQKIGHFNPDTWGAYLLGSELFLKRSRADTGKSFPDLGCSFEIFTRDDMLELETLGPLTKLEPRETVEHVETWTLYRHFGSLEFSDAGLDSVLLPRLTGKG